MSNNYIFSDGNVHVYFLLPIRCCLPCSDLPVDNLSARVLDYTGRAAPCSDSQHLYPRNTG